MPDANNAREVVITVTADEEEQMRGALRQAGLPAEGSVDELVREVMRSRLPHFLGRQRLSARLLRFGR